MEEKTLQREEQRLSNEIVETYRPQDPREVVETYRRPLPGTPSVRKQAAPAPEKRRRKTGLWIFLLLAVLLGALAAGAWFLNRQEPEEPYQAGEETPGKGQEITIPTYPFGQGAELQISRKQGEKRTPQEIYAEVNPSVVTVIVQLEDDAASVGTGVIFSQDGYILTNYHVVEGGLDCVIMLDSGFTYDAEYVAGDAKNDLAVLKSDLEKMPAAEFGDSDLLTVGDPVYAIGNPLGVELRGTFTNGIVSAIDRDVEVDGRNMTLIQTNAALNSGNSGGPLINEYGQVVGINVIKMSSGYSSVEGLGFSIPSSAVDRLVNDLLTYGEVQPEPKLGMSVLQVGEEVLPGTWGVEVVEILPGSAADLAGMQVGDFVVSVGKTPVRISQDVLKARRQYHLGDQMLVTVCRDGQLVELTLDLQEATE